MFKYHTLVDRYASKRAKASEFDTVVFYGRLDNIFVVQLPPAPQLDQALTAPSTLILAGITTCPITATNARDMPYYDVLGRYEVVDVECVQCLVGRMKVSEGKWVIIDRSGGIEHSFYIPDD